MQVRHDVVNQLVKNKAKYEHKITGSGSLLGDFASYTAKMRNEGEWGDHLELQAAADLYGVDINIYNVKTGADRPNMIIESTGEIEYLPISLWFEDNNHYHAFVESPEMNEVRDAPTAMDQAHSEEMSDDDFGMPSLPSKKRMEPISCEIESRPISRGVVTNASSLPSIKNDKRPVFEATMSGFDAKEEGKTDKQMSEELKEDVLIAGQDFEDFVDRSQ